MEKRQMQMSLLVATWVATVCTFGMFVTSTVKAASADLAADRAKAGCYRTIDTGLQTIRLFRALLDDPAGAFQVAGEQTFKMLNKEERRLKEDHQALCSP
jgi:hypothetical protein